MSSGRSEGKAQFGTLSLAASRDSLFVSWHDINFLVPKNRQDKAWEDLSEAPSIMNVVNSNSVLDTLPRNNLSLLK